MSIFFERNQPMKPPQGTPTVVKADLSNSRVTECPRCEGEGIIRMETRPKYNACKRCLGTGVLQDFEIEYLRKYL